MFRRISGFFTLVIGSLGLMPFGQKLLQAYFWDWIVRMLNGAISSFPLTLATIGSYTIPGCLILLGLYLLLPHGKRRLTPVFNQIYRNQVIKVDGKDFQNCIFENVTFEFDGGPWNFGNCRVVGIRRFETPSPKIAGGISLLKFIDLLGDQQFVADWHTVPDEHFRR